MRQQLDRKEAPDQQREQRESNPLKVTLENLAHGRAEPPEAGCY